MKPTRKTELGMAALALGLIFALVAQTERISILSAQEPVAAVAKAEAPDSLRQNQALLLKALDACVCAKEQMSSICILLDFNIHMIRSLYQSMLVFLVIFILQSTLLLLKSTIGMAAMNTVLSTLLNVFISM